MKSVPLIQMILMVLLLPVEYSSGQSRGNPSFKVKKVSIQDQGTRLQCLSCSSDFSTVLLDTNDICYNPSGASPQQVKKSLLTICPMDVAFCVVNINRIAGVFSGITRSCGSSSCVESCSQAGYGTERETCTFCCSGIPTNSSEEDGMSTDKFNCP